jgi:hypothetical protein
VVLALGVAGGAALAPPLCAQRAVPPLQGDVPAASAVRAGVVVRPDTVTIGDPFTVVVAVEVPAGARIEWPSLDDSAASVGLRTPVRVQPLDGPRPGERAEYELAAWQLGTLAVGLPDVRVVLPDGGLVRVPVAASVTVRSVLPGDTTLHVPKPAKALFPRDVPWWRRWWPALAVLAALAALAGLARRRRRRRPDARAVEGPDPYARALHEFARLERLALPDAGERGRYVALAVDVLRLYLAARLPAAALSRTRAELLAAVDGDPRVPHQALAELLDEADQVKFARRALGADEARGLVALARRVVELVERAEAARVAAEAAAREAERAAGAGARREHEDAARRRSRRHGVGA